MTSLGLFVDVKRGKGLYETVLIREYAHKPGYIPEEGDHILIGSRTYKVVGRRVSYPAVSGGPDCFLTLHVEEVQESALKRFWCRLRGQKRKRLEE